MGESINQLRFFPLFIDINGYQQEFTTIHDHGIPDLGDSDLPTIKTRQLMGTTWNSTSWAYQILNVQSKYQPSDKG